MESTILNQQAKQLKNKIIQDILDYSTKNPESITFQKIIGYLVDYYPNFIITIFGIENGVIRYDTPVVVNKPYDINNISIEVLIKIKEELEFYEKQKDLKKQTAL